MLGAPRHDEELAWPEDHVAVTHLDGELAAQDEEQLVGVVVLVPGEVALELDDPHVVVVEVPGTLPPIWRWVGPVGRASNAIPEGHSESGGGRVSRAAVSGSVVAGVLRLCEGSGQDDGIR